MNKRHVILALVTSGLFISGCNSDGKPGSRGDNGTDALVHISTLAIGSEQCAMGGQLLQSGQDDNRNGVLDLNEIDKLTTKAVCHGQTKSLQASLIGRYQSEIYGLSAAEIVDFHPQSQQIFVINAQSGKVDVLDGSELSGDNAVQGAGALALNNVQKITEIDVAADLKLTRLGGVNSLSIFNDLLAVAIERGDEQNHSRQGNGFVAFYRLTAAGQIDYLHGVKVGALPDNVTFNRDGTLLLVANEGEPSDDYTVDPQGSVSVVQINDNTPAMFAEQIGFTTFNQGAPRAQELDDEIKINGPNASTAQDLEPEYIAISQDNDYAYVSLQENNAIAVINLAQRSVEAILPLGLKDYGLAKNRIDASDKDDRIQLNHYAQVYGMYQPDTISVTNGTVLTLL